MNKLGTSQAVQWLRLHAVNTEGHGLDSWSGNEDCTCWSGLLFPPPGDLPNPGIEPGSPALAGEFFTAEPSGKH